MSYLVSVLLLLCDLFADEHNYKTILFFLSSIVFLNKRFIIASSNYWSSTTNASNSDNAWNVNFNNGNDNANNKTNSNYVRCVRAGE